MTGAMAGIYPAVIKSYDPATRLCRVHIPAITGGGDAFPVAEIMYPIGDKSQTRNGVVTTEIEVLVDDPVWVMFIQNNPAYPVIIGYRNPRAGNDVDTRRYHHANIQLIADSALNLNAATGTITTSGNLTLNIGGNVAINSASLKHNGVNVGQDHKHGNVQSGGSQTGNPA